VGILPTSAKAPPAPAENVAAVFNRHAQYLKIDLAIKSRRHDAITAAA
jgi:hypothetical protein